MKPIRIDFAPPSLKRTLLRTRPGTWAVGVIGALLCLSGGIQATRLWERIESNKAELREMASKRAKDDAAKPAPKKFTIAESHAASLNAATLQLNIPWRDVLNALEEATPSDIALLSIEPDAKKRLVKGSAEAKTSDAMIAYVEMLKQQPFFYEVVLTKHEVNVQDANRPIRFAFQAHWAESAQ